MKDNMKYTNSPNGSDRSDIAGSDENSYGDKRTTPVFTTGDISFFIEASKLTDGDTDDYHKLPTNKAPITLTKLYAARTRNVLEKENFGDSEIAQKIITILDPLIINNRPSQEIYDALHNEMDKNNNISIKEKIWDIAVEALKVIINDLFEHITEDYFDEDNVLKLERFFRTCFSKVISPTLRQHVVFKTKKLFEIMLLSSKQQHSTANAFVVAIINHLSTNGKEIEIVGSERTLQAFRSQRIIEPKNELRTPEAFTYSYSNRTNRIFDYLAQNSSVYPQAASALSLLRRTQNLGVIPKDMSKLTCEQFEEICHEYFAETLRILKIGKHKDISKIIISMWNEIIAPQLIIAGELLLPHSQFLLPE